MTMSEESKVHPAEKPARRPLTPEARALAPGLAGTPITLAGMTWFLAPGGVHGALDELRDHLFDQACLRGGFLVNEQLPGVADDYYSVADVAAYLLTLHYDLDEREAATLVTRGCEPAALCEAVHAALFGASSSRRTYTDWARGSLLAAGLDPRAIPPGDVPLVLELLVKAGRAVPSHEFVSSQRAAPQLDIWRSLVRRTPAG
jgi:hypothetical protein